MKGVDYETEKQLVEDLRNELLHSKVMIASNMATFSVI